MGGQVGVPGGKHKRNRGNSRAKQQAYRQTEKYKEGRKIYESLPNVRMMREIREKMKKHNK